MIPEERILSFYGDDFTGSTDVMEVLAINGLKTVLFLDIPDEGRLAQFPHCRAVGIAGKSRSQTPSWMSKHLPRIFDTLQQLGAPLCHYKICSTFDSSPNVGNIGRAIEIGQAVFGAPYVPVVVGVPALRRYCVFGNLFATVDDMAYRLDRHPTMSRHPVTPMVESDLRLHLAQQTSKPTALLDILALQSTDPAESLRMLLTENPEIVFFDVLDEASLHEVGHLLWTLRSKPQAFIVGSSGVEYALTACWRSAGELPPPEQFSGAGRAERMLVVSGSCSPVTELQIRWAMANGFEAVQLDAAARLSGVGSTENLRDVIRPALAKLEAGRSVIVYTVLGPEDSRLLPSDRRDSNFHERLGRLLGRILQTLLKQSGVRRAVICGGDTSAHAGSQLGIYAVTMLSPLAPGSPLCLTCSDESDFDGLEIVFKGGQAGSENFLDLVQRGGTSK